jgi:hypothetical protein
VCDDWHMPDTGIPTRQGDLLLSRDPKKGLVEAICLVITADCDIAQNKFGTHLAVLRVIPLQDYLRTVWAERRLRKLLDTETENIRSQLNKWNAQRLGEASSLTAGGITRWVRDCQPDEICRDLEVPEAVAAKLRASIGMFRSALLAIESGGGPDSLAKLIAFRSVIFRKPRSDCLKEALKQASGEPLPDDVFLLPILPQLDTGPAVILLRDMLGVPRDLVCFRSCDATSERHFLRVGSLHPTLKHAVSQAFGNLYARIGLPEAHEARRREAIEKVNTFQWE